MADDANFCGGRLRLTAFLRVVENGIPPRPSRFKRRVALVEESSQDPVRLELSCTENTTNVQDAPVSDRSYEAGAEVLSEVPPRTCSEFDIPRSPTPTHARPCLGLDEHFDFVSNMQAGTTEQRSPIHTIKQARAENADVHIQKDEATSGGCQRPSDTRKRRLPVNGLALLRTTTLDGLPKPSDACKDSAVLVTDYDPINDSELIVSSCNGVCSPSTNSPRSQSSQRPGAQCSRHPLQTIVSTVGHGPRSPGSFSLKQTKFSIPKLHSLSIPMKPKQQARTSLHFVADGFVGSELRIELTKKSQRRAKVVPRQSKSNLAVARLALVTGLLPTPIVQHAEMMATPNNMPSEALYEPLKIARGPAQLDSIRAQGLTDGRQTQIRQVARGEHTVRNQLSSITAPLRRESESSESDVVTEREFVVDGEEMEEIIHTQQFPPPSGTSTIAEDHGYFESAMYHLDIAQTTESVNNEFWSQYNAVD